jgi:hypothetical protein
VSRPVELLLGKWACPRQPVPIGHIYFILAPAADAIKIGFSRDPRKRFTNLRTGSPEPLEWLGSIPGDPGDEKAIYKRFKHQRLHGEWFRASPELYNHMEDLAEDNEEIQGWLDLRAQLEAEADEPE